MNLKLDELTKEELQKIIEKIAKRLSKEQYEYLIDEYGVELIVAPDYVSKNNLHSLKTAAAMFLVYSVLNGITLSAVFLTYTLSSIGGVFFMTAGTFGIMSVYGYVTKADLSKLGNMCLMGLFGIILATVVGFFFDSTLLQMLISYAGILIFTGLTIYDTQSIKRLALTYHSRATDEGQKIAIMGALTLYLDFINIFIYLLRLFGEKK